MRPDFASYLITVAILLIAGIAAWFILWLANPNTAATLKGNESTYAPLQQQILNNR